MKKKKVGILGATGAVGQKFIRLLQNHPWFSVEALGASAKSAGKPYKQAVHWIEDVEMPESASELTVTECKPELFSEVDFVFSGLDSSAAGDIEPAFARAGIPVISNAKNYRMDERVPLLIPEINPEHIELINSQGFTDDNSGWIVTNPNCVCVPLAMSLKPIYSQFGIESVTVTALQSVSGAGYPGESSMDMIGNVVPHIGGEEDKIGREPLKMLGKLKDNSRIEPAGFDVQATSVRVPTVEGHLLSISLQTQTSPDDLSDLRHAIENYSNPIAPLELPSAPDRPIKLYDEPRFPQPRLHSKNQNGMQTSIGRLRETPVSDISYVTLAHNTVRGAAGGAVLNAELLVKKGYIN